MKKSQKTIRILVVIITILVIAVYSYQKINSSLSLPNNNLQTINATFCDNIYVKDIHTLIFISRDDQGRALSTTTVDVSDVSGVQNTEDTVVKEVVIPIKNWLASLPPANWSSILDNECAPGSIHISGEMNEQGLFVASQITEHTE